jgi:hypothetical protein
MRVQSSSSSQNSPHLRPLDGFFSTVKRVSADWLEVLKLWIKRRCAAVEEVNLPKEHIITGFFPEQCGQAIGTDFQDDSGPERGSTHRELEGAQQIGKKPV